MLCRIMMAAVGMVVAMAGIPMAFAASVGGHGGAVCIAPIPESSFFPPVPRENTGDRDPDSNFEISIDGRKRVKVSLTKSVMVKDLDLKKRHVVAVYDEKKLVTSFRFSFSSYGTGVLCLWQKDLYRTWSLWDYYGSSAVGCKCAVD
jgi:hypothetical protein